MSPGAPKATGPMKPAVVLKMNHVPVDGRKTARSVRVSLS
jgi:hypothetical protein